MTKERLDLVMKQFEAMSGLEPEQAERFWTLVTVAAQELEGRLRRGADTPKQEERIVLLCAANACYKYRLLSAADGCGLTVGEVSVKEDTGRQAAHAHRLLVNLCAGCADILKDEEFVFERVDA